MDSANSFCSSHVSFIARGILDLKRAAALNMAIDEALLRLCKEPVVRFYQWSEKVVSIGYFQAHEVVPQGRAFIRRYTGGGLVDHAADITYSLIFPKGHPLYLMGTAQSYQTIHASVACGLAKLGLNSGLAQKAMEEEHVACFQRPVKSDLLLGERKLAGAAQRRTREGCLHQGSLLLPDGFSFEKVVEVLLPALKALLGEGGQVSSMTMQEEDLARRLEKERYSSREWNFWR